MPVTTTAAEFAAFTNDDAYWEQSGWDHYDETVFVVEGQETNDLDVDSLSPETPIRVKYGAVVNMESGESSDLPGFFAKWQKQRASRLVAIHLPMHLTIEQLAEHLAQLDPQIIVAADK